MPPEDPELCEAVECDESSHGENESNIGVAPDGDLPPIPGVMLASHGVSAGLVSDSFRPLGLVSSP